MLTTTSTQSAPARVRAACALLGAVVWGVAFLSAAQPPSFHYSWLDRGSFGGVHVVIPERPTEEIARAAEAFTGLWKIATGQVIKASTQNEGATNVWLGRAATPQDLLPSRLTDHLTENEFMIQTYKPTPRQQDTDVGRHLLIIGGSDRAVIDAVYTFFMRYLGVRWLTPDQPPTPAPTMFIPEIELEVSPVFKYRGLGLAERHSARAKTFGRALRLSELDAPAKSAGVRPPALPDAPKPDDKLPAGPLCPLDPAAAKVAAAELSKVLAPDGSLTEATLKERRECIGWAPGKRAWCLSNLAWIGFDQCGACKDYNRKHGSPGAAWLTLSNRVANTLQANKKTRGHRIQFFAQGDHRTPPSELTVHPAVDLWIDTADCDFRVPLDAGNAKRNTSFADDLEAWTAKTDAVYIWDYLAHATHPQSLFPALHVLQANLRFYDQHEVRGVYFAGLARPKTTLPLEGLNRYLGAVLLWDPDYPVPEAIGTFCRNEYGAAAQNVLAYLAEAERVLPKMADPLSPVAQTSGIDATTAAALQAALGDPPLDGLKAVAREEIVALQEAIDSLTQP